MKIFCFFVFLFALLSCSNQQANSAKKLDYLDFENRTILWGEVFSIDSDLYYVYIFSKTCSYCNEIKDDILDFADKNEYFYFLEYVEEVVISNYVDDTIGINDINNLKILGTPSLLKIDNGILVDNVSGKSKIMNLLRIKFT